MTSRRASALGVVPSSSHGLRVGEDERDRLAGVGLELRGGERRAAHPAMSEGVRVLLATGGHRRMPAAAVSTAACPASGRAATDIRRYAASDACQPFGVTGSTGSASTMSRTSS